MEGGEGLPRRALTIPLRVPLNTLPFPFPFLYLILNTKLPLILLSSVKTLLFTLSVIDSWIELRRDTLPSRFLD